MWKALTDPALIPLWTWTGRGGRSEGFEPEAGNRFRFAAKPFPGWDGIVRCEVLTVDEPSLLRYTWRNNGDRPSIVTNCLDDTPTGTRFTYEHTDFHGLEGLIMSSSWAGSAAACSPKVPDRPRHPRRPGPAPASPIPPTPMTATA